MRHGACKAQRDRRTKQEAPGFGVENLAAKLKRQISHTKVMGNQIRPPPLYTMTLQNEPAQMTTNTCGPAFSSRSSMATPAPRKMLVPHGHKYCLQ